MKTLWITIAGIISMIGAVFFAFIKGQKSGSDSEKVKSQEDEIERKDRELKDVETAKKIREDTDNLSYEQLADKLCKKDNNK